MKKIVLIITVLFLTVFANMAEAQDIGIVQINKDGNYYVLEPSTWTSTAIITIGNAKYYTAFFQEAIDNPGDSILVSKTERLVKLKLFFKKIVTIEKFFIVYSQEEDAISFVKEPPYEEEQNFFFILVSLFAIVVMVLSNMVSGYKKRATLASEIAFSATALACMAAAFSVADILDSAMTFPVLTTIFACSATVTGLLVAVLNNKGYKIASFFFYLTMTAYIIFMFI